jgi:hypothetical protein
LTSVGDRQSGDRCAIARGAQATFPRSGPRRPRNRRASVGPPALGSLEGARRLFATPAANPALQETEITLASSSDIDSGKPPAAKTGATPLSRQNAPELKAPPPPADSPSAADRPQARSDVWTQSQVILSSQELADPRNRKTVETLKHLEPQTRFQQLCDFEAILQINRQFNQYAVDFVIAYATQAVVRKGDALIARGAAFHSNGQWYNLAFECQLSANQRDVAHLKFKLGDPISGDQWADLNLPKSPANPMGGGD